MGAIAEGFVVGMATAAQTDSGTSGEAERLTCQIDDFKVALDTDRAVVFDGNFCGGHGVSRPSDAARKKKS